MSHHLKVLLAAGLVKVRAEGQRRLYAIDDEGVAAARNWLEALRNPVEALVQPLDALATEIARGQRERRKGLAEKEQGQTKDDRQAG